MQGRVANTGTQTSEELVSQAECAALLESVFRQVQSSTDALMARLERLEHQDMVRNGFGQGNSVDANNNAGAGNHSQHGDLEEHLQIGRTQKAPQPLSDSHQRDGALGHCRQTGRTQGTPQSLSDASSHRREVALRRCQVLLPIDELRRRLSSMSDDEL